MKAFEKEKVPCYHIGQSAGSGLQSNIEIVYDQHILVSGVLKDLLKQWERTSFELEKLQASEACAKEEFSTYEYRVGPTYKCSLNPDSLIPNPTDVKTLVAVVREEGTNGDREMIASLLDANFAVHDIAMNDLLEGRITLDRYRGVVFPGGFSYADTLGSAKGWAASILYNEPLRRQFLHFKNRLDTFSLGVCNGNKRI